MTVLETTQMGGHTIFYRPGSRDLRVARSCLENGEFAELATDIPVLTHNLIIDAGGFIGTAAIAFAEMFPDARVVTVEASSDNFAILQRNVAAYPNIVPINKALMATRRTMQLRDRGTGDWGFTIVETPRDHPTTDLEMVSGITIPDIMALFGASGIDIVKLDIEGGEKEVLEAADAWLPQTTLMLAELHEKILLGCRDAFTRANGERRTKKYGREKFGSIMQVDPATVSANEDIDLSSLRQEVEVAELRARLAEAKLKFGVADAELRVRSLA